MTTPHAHQWVIEPQNGRNLVEGRCTVCGETKMFSNYIDDASVRHGWPPQRRVTSGRKRR